MTMSACQDVAAPTGNLAPSSQLTTSANAQGAASQIAGQYIVTLRPSVSDVRSEAADIVSRSNGVLGFTYGTALKGFSAKLSEQAAAALTNNPNVLSVEPDQSVAAAGFQKPAPWWLDRLDQRTARLDTSYTWPNSGAGVTVYILDTGIRITHQDLQGRASYGYDFVGGSTTANDCNGHGTHVAGLVGGSYYGVAKGVSMKAVRVLDCSGNGTTSTIIAGLDWVAKNHTSPAVANLSLSSAYSSALNGAIASTIASGVTVVVSAGDANISGHDACNVSPASAPSAITVGAMISQFGSDSQGSFSNDGSCVDLFAPGYQIASDWIASDTDWDLVTGTSPAAPLVAGAAAIYLAGNASATPSQVSAAILGAATTGVLSGLGAGTPNRLLYIGDGTTPLPDPTPTPTPANAAPVASFTASCQRASCTFNASASTDDTGISNYTWTFGDGTSATGSNVMASHVYATKGSYAVALTVTDRGGLTSRSQKNVTIKSTGR
jgi:subtilisin family serine protease